MPLRQLIVARNVLFQLAEEDLTNESLKENVDHFAKARGIDSVIITNDGKLLFSGKKELKLNSDVWTLQKDLGLRHRPEQLLEFFPLPDNFVIKYFVDGYDETKVYHTVGEKFRRIHVDTVLQHHAERECTQKKNQRILSWNMAKLVEDGTVSVLDVSRVEEGKKMYKREINNKPDLEGECDLYFERWKTDRTEKRPVKMVGEFPPVEVTLVGRPRQTDIKLKHYAIYSKLPGFGKTYEFKCLSEFYNVHFVNDPNNWTTVPSSAQFLVFDEVGYFHNRLDFEYLKALTGGTTSAFTAHGGSFTPRKDVQVVMLSSRSPYDIYGKWNAALGRRIMTREEMDQFHERFEVFRLDGSVEEDRVLHSTPDVWSDDQFRGECKKIVDELFESLTERRSVEGNVEVTIMAIDMIVYLCKQREPEKKFSVDMRVIDILLELEKGRFWPTLVETFTSCYDATATKRKGRALVKARDLLAQRASIEDTRFENMRVIQLTAYIARRPSSAYGLYFWYANRPPYIDFYCEDKERVFRACLSVHSDNATDEEENSYRTLVFDRLWEIARDND